MNRSELDALVEHYRLPEPAVRAALELSDARPSEEETRRFVTRVLRLAGVLSLAAGVVFFVAANWDALRVLGRFVLLEAVLLATIGVALWRPAPHVLGLHALLAAFLTTGALLALFGQTYQTGADVYELFLTWAGLGVLFALAGQWSVLWAAWVLVLNVALALYVGFQPLGGLLWVLLGGWGLQHAALVLLPVAVNLALWLAMDALRTSRFAHVAPQWLARFALACGVAFATWAGMLAIIDDTEPAQRALTLVLVAAALGGICVHALRRRADVLPLALVAGSVIVLGTCAIAEWTGFEDSAVFFTLALWLIVSSTLAGRLLMRLVRAWRAPEGGR